MTDSPPISYTFSAELADMIKKLAIDNNIGEHQVLERSIGLYNFARRLTLDGGRLLAQSPDGQIRVLNT